jgi:predicted nucleic acid-binding protein
MKIVIDTNILFSFFWKDSLTRRLIITSEIELISPEVALEEIKKYSYDLTRRLKISNREFHEYFKKLKGIVKFIPKKEYHSFLNDAERICPDKKDAEFFALCLKYSCSLWSNDSILKNQNRINVLSTQDIIDIMF